MKSQVMIGDAPAGTQGGCGCGGCGCGGGQVVSLPVLDAREIPPAVRHGAIFGALESLQVGAGVVLVAPHDPLPLLDQLQDREPDAFDIEYVERGPEAWALAFVRTRTLQR